MFKSGASANTLSVGVLGPVLAVPDGQWEAPPTRQVGRVLATLAGWPGEKVDHEVLVNALWGDEPPGTVKNTLQVHVSHLRRWLGAHLVSHRDDGYVLNLDPQAVDVQRFSLLLDAATASRRRGDLEAAVELTQEALTLVRGTAYPDLLDPELRARRTRLGELADQARENLLEWRLDLARDSHDLGNVIADAREMVERFPLRERGYCVLMRALASAQRNAEAEVVYSTAEQLLQERHGLQPGAELRATRQRCRDQDPSVLPLAMRTAASA